MLVLDEPSQQDELKKRVLHHELCIAHIAQMGSRGSHRREGRNRKKKIKIQNEKGSNSNLYCIGDEFRLFPPFIQLPRLDFCLGLSTNQFNPFEYVWCINILFERAETQYEQIKKKRKKNLINSFIRYTFFIYSFTHLYTLYSSIKKGGGRVHFQIPSQMNKYVCIMIYTINQYVLCISIHITEFVEQIFLQIQYICQEPDLNW